MTFYPSLFSCPQLHPTLSSIHSIFCVFLPSSTFLFWGFSPPNYYQRTHFSLDLDLHSSPILHGFFESHHFYEVVSVSLFLLHAINVSDCPILHHVKDMRGLSNRSEDSVWTRNATSFYRSHTHARISEYLT